MNDYQLVEEFKHILPESVIFNLTDELVITEDLDTEVDRGAARFGYYSIMFDKADEKVRRLRLALEIWEGKTKSDRNKLSDQIKEKRLTEKLMDAHVVSQPQYLKFMNQLNRLETERGELKSITRAFEKKCDMVQTKCSNRRFEMKRTN